MAAALPSRASAPRASRRPSRRPARRPARAAPESSGARVAVAERWSDEPRLSDEYLYAIIKEEVTDQEINELVWECLGYTKEVDLDPDTMSAVERWDPSGCFPKWAERYPEPPDVIGVTRKYYPDVDEPVKRASQALTRSVPATFKQGIKTALRPLGWNGFKLDELTPNRTRRAQVVNWLVYYRAELHNVPLEELLARKAKAAESEAKEKVKAPTGTTKQSVL